MCAECGERRMTTAYVEGQTAQTASRRAWLEGQVRWARNGGIDRADQGQLWKARKRKQVREYEAELANWPDSPSPSA